jgi:hypothetical protein
MAAPLKAPCWDLVIPVHPEKAKTRASRVKITINFFIVYYPFPLSGLMATMVISGVMFVVIFMIGASVVSIVRPSANNNGGTVNNRRGIKIGWRIINRCRIDPNWCGDAYTNSNGYPTGPAILRQKSHCQTQHCNHDD